MTQPELRRELRSSEIANGFANRYLFGVSRRPQKIARPKRIDVSAHASRIRQVVDQAQRLDSPVGFTDNGAAAWELVYERLEDEAEQADGLIGPLVARGSAHTLRLALIYSLLDGKAAIGADHIESALAVWGYCSSSVRHIFVGASGDALADKIVERLNAEPHGLTMTQVHAIGGNHYPKSRIEVAIERLVESGRYETKELATGGRPATVLRAREQSEVSEESKAQSRVSSHSSLSSQEGQA